VGALLLALQTHQQCWLQQAVAEASAKGQEVQLLAVAG
jgi:hypothetical protein